MMGPQDEPVRPIPELVEINVSKYKNLEEVHLPWSTGVVLFGPNGSGKSNLLEALTLLLGSQQSLALFNWPAMPPIDPQRWGLSAVIANDTAATQTYGNLSRDLADADWLRAQFGTRFHDEHIWWQDVDPKWDGSVRAWVESIKIPAEVRAVVERALDASVVMYTLKDLTPNAPTTAQRQFSRALMIHRDEISDLDRSDLGALPEVFSPLLRKPNRRSDWSAVMRLPVTPLAPVSVQYLRRHRSPAQRRHELDAAIEEASDGVVSLIEALAESDLFTSVKPETLEAEWFLQKRGEREATRELAAIFPSLRISPRAVFYPGADLEVVAKGVGDRPDRQIDVLLTGEELKGAKQHGQLPVDSQNLESGLSSAQGRWADEALAIAAERIREFGRQAALWAHGLVQSEFDDLFELLMPEFDAIESELRRHEYWTDELFNRIIDVLIEHLEHTVESKISAVPADWRREAFRWLVVPHGREPGPTMIRCFDEPEAHLDALTQRRVASRLLSLQRTGKQVAIASHSALFLGLPDFSLIRARVGKTHTLFSTPDLQESKVRRAIAKDMGLGQGELLTGISSLLIVEGAHDRIMLEAFANLREHGMWMLRMHGTDDNELFATASLDFVDEYLDVPIAVLLDHTSEDRVDRAQNAHQRGLTSEEQKLVGLKLSAQDAGREFKPFGLARADVTMYLNETVVREHSTNFSSWKDADRTYMLEPAATRPKFKSWLRRTYGLDLSSEKVALMAADMRRRSMPPEGDFLHRAELIETWAAARHEPLA